MKGMEARVTAYRSGSISDRANPWQVIAQTRIDADANWRDPQKVTTRKTKAEAKEAINAVAKHFKAKGYKVTTKTP